jgi:hypothetical protein
VALSGSSDRFGQVRWNVHGCFSIDRFIEKSEFSHFFPCFPVSASQGFVGWLKPHRKKTLNQKKSLKPG